MLQINCWMAALQQGTRMCLTGSTADRRKELSTGYSLGWCSPSPAPSQSPSSAKPSILWLLAKRQQFLQVEDAHWSPLLSWASAGDCISKHRPFSLTPLLEAALTECTTEEEVRSSHPLGHPEKESCFGGLGLLKSLRPQGAAFSSRGLRSWG